MRKILFATAAIVALAVAGPAIAKEHHHGKSSAHGEVNVNVSATGLSSDPSNNYAPSAVVAGELSLEGRTKGNAAITGSFDVSGKAKAESDFASAKLWDSGGSATICSGKGC